MNLTDEQIQIVNDLKTHGFIWVYENLFEKEPLKFVTKLIPFLPVAVLIDGELNPLYTEYKYLAALMQLACTKMQRYRNPLYIKIENLLQHIEKASKILVITGAGISVSAGIPDFRSPNGLYSQLLTEYPELTEPQEMFDLRVFKDNPAIFYSFAHKIYPSNFKPTISHLFVGELEKRGKLLRNYTQNIDGLENLVGLKNVIQCHGSFEFAYCLKCNDKFDGQLIKEEIFKKQVPICKKCPPSEDDPAVIKPCITFFHEKLPQTFDDAIEQDCKDCDLVVVMGSSLKVAPVAELVHLIDPKVPQILINREVLTHLKDHFDIQLLGDSDVIIEHLSQQLKWSLNSTHFEPQDMKFVEPNHYLFQNGKLAPPSEPSESEEESSDSNENSEEDISIADEQGLDADELAGLYKDAEDMEEIATKERIKNAHKLEDLDDLESQSDVEFNPYKKAKVEAKATKVEPKNAVI